MKKYFNTVAILLLSLFFVSCATKQPSDLRTVEKVNLQHYLGDWYEIARYEHHFQKDCKNVKATYSLRDDKKIQVVNSCTKISTNEFKEAKAVAYSVDETNSKLKVSFFRPFYGDYWILDLDKNYTYAIVGTGSKEYLWILSRQKTMDKATLNTLLEKITSLGFDTSKLSYTIQE
jgi:apolipoprotein D and lipocalin family protein